MNRVRWGVLGCAQFAQKRTIPALLECRNAELVGVASRDPQKAEAFRSQFDLKRAYGSYEEMLADPAIEAVYNPLPNGLHGTWMLKAAESGKHTLCEKPFASNAEEARRVAQLADRLGVFVMEGFMWRFHPQHELARELVQRGEIGEVKLLRACFTFRLERRPDVRLDPDLAGGSVMDVGCYPISGARYYFSDEPTEVYAQGTRPPEYRVDMNMSGLLMFPGGRALIDCGFDRPFRSEIEIVGEEGSIVIPTAWLPGDDSFILVNGERKAIPNANQYVNEFEHFGDSIRSGASPRYGPDDAIRQMQVIDAVVRSIRSGLPEKV